MNEAETIDAHILPALRAAGWSVADGSRIRREYPIAPGRIEGRGRRPRTLKADIVLEYRKTKLAMVEAKAIAEALTEGVGQAKDYAVDQEKLTPLLRLKYHDSIADAVADLGQPAEIGKVFAGFQRHLYEVAA